MPRDPETPRAERSGANVLQRFLTSSAASSYVLVVAVGIALVWANSPLADAYDRLWTTPLALRVGETSVGTDLRFWVSDGLMTIFFLLVGIEIDREIRTGDLGRPRVVALPAIAAVGGMVVPALIYLAVARGGAAPRGWGVPMATDIALALGVLGIAARHAAPDVRPLLLTLAIVDDVGAIIVVTLFYATGGEPLALVAAAVIVTAIVITERIGIGVSIVPIVLGAALWYAFLRAGIEPAIAGVVVGLLTPASAIGRFERVLLLWSGFLIVPLFALANAGVRLDPATLFVGAGGLVALGIVVARLVGKPLGVVAAARLGVTTRISALPPGTGWGSMFALGVTAGIGFTVSLFIADLAFADDRALLDAAKVGIMVSAVLAGAGSYLTFRLESAASGRRSRA